MATTDVGLRARLAAALAKEIGTLGRRVRRPLDTLYLGGGTPSLLEVAELVPIVTAVRRSFAVAEGAEWTIEANPDDVTEEQLRLWAELGFTRVSMGVQSFDDDVLRRLGRRHDGQQARAAVAAALRWGFAVNADLMLGVPGGRADHVRRSLEEILALRPHHVSVYLLELDKRTPMARQAARTPEEFPSEGASARAYLAVGRALVAAGYRHYEVSNFARDGHVARHNLLTWRGGTVFGVGPAAAGHAGRRRFANVADITAYLARVESGRRAQGFRCALSSDAWVRERVMLGLRLASGVPERMLERLDSESFHQRLSDFLALGLARRVGGRVRLAPRGWLVSNELLAHAV